MTASTTPRSVCLTCRFAEWKRTEAGRLHPSGEGRCAWKFEPPPMSAAWWWGWHCDPTPGKLKGGWIRRHAKGRGRGNFVTACPVHEEIAAEPSALDAAHPAERDVARARARLMGEVS